MYAKGRGSRCNPVVRQTYVLCLAIIWVQVSALVSSPIPEALLYAQAEKEYQAKLLELVQKGLARPEDVEKQLTQEGLDAFIEAE